MPQPPPPLPTNRAFVVQFRAQPAGAPIGWDGRVEQVVSGQVTHFRRRTPRAISWRGSRGPAAPERGQL